MSIVTRTGDKGTTGLMYNRRVSKGHPRVQAYGEVDELNAALGMARASAEHLFVKENIRSIQDDLIILMGELATLPEDLARYQNDGFRLVTPTMTQKLDGLAREIEAQLPPSKGWAKPGENLSAATLDLARTVCRRAERAICALDAAGQLHNPEIIVFLNRLSDLLWLFGRWVEQRAFNAS